jgi:hypothetical protein
VYMAIFKRAIDKIIRMEGIEATIRNCYLKFDNAGLSMIIEIIIL